VRKNPERERAHKGPYKMTQKIIRPDSLPKNTSAKSSKSKKDGNEESPMEIDENNRFAPIQK